LLWVLRGISEEWSGWCVCERGLVGVENLKSLVIGY
jgi:hypothetical protein